MNYFNHASITALFMVIGATACSVRSGSRNDAVESRMPVKPVIITEKVRFDSDDPAIWVNPADPEESLIIGTDKGTNGAGGLYVFSLDGQLVDSVTPLYRPNNVDVAYGLAFKGRTTDIAVCTERNTNRIRVFSLPDMTPLDNGGIPVFEGDSLRDPMGLALFTNPADHAIFAVVGRKSGPSSGYLHQYRLHDDGKGAVTGTLVRKFGKFSGHREIEAIAVDNEAGYVYYADEGFGVRKYYAHPDSSGTELAVFATEGFAQDHEGISIYKTGDKTGYILVSDQQANVFRIFTREGTSANPHDHTLVRVVPVSTNESDGSEITNSVFRNFPRGLFVAMSDNGTFQFYRAEDILY